MASVASDTFIRDKSWNLITLNSELLIFTVIGIIGTLAEAAGYGSFTRLTNLIHPLPFTTAGSDVDKLPGVTENSTFMDFTNKANDVVSLLSHYTAHVYLATYLLLPYPLIMERLEVLLAPWLILGLLRSLLKELVLSLTGIALCAAQDTFYYPCLQYSALQGVQLCCAIYFWTSVHSFYYCLSRVRSGSEVIKSIQRATKSIGDASFLSKPSGLMKISMIDEDDDVPLDAKLVERAAMAWIAREILESDSEYVNDQQFGNYLAIKATMELRQALKELVEKNKYKRKSINTKMKIQQSLEFMKHPNESAALQTEAFETSRTLSRRDPIRRIRPLTCHGKPTLDDDEISINGLLGEITARGSDDTASTVSAESQTEPPTPEMRRLLDILEEQLQKRQQEIPPSPE